MQEAETRQERAIEAALQVAASFGVAAHVPEILHDSNNTVIHLSPAPIVAKVRTTPSQRRSFQSELGIGLYPADQDALAVRPSREIPPVLHMYDGLELTFWEWCPHDPGVEVDGRKAGHALRRLHDALAGYAGRLPSYTRDLEEVGSILAREETLQSLDRSDKAFLREVHETGYAPLEARTLAIQPLHGEAHLGNLLASADGPRWIDFEAACIGPPEWDFASLPDEALDAFPNVDLELLRHLRLVHHLCVAVWCWLNPDRDPILRLHGEIHLEALRDGHQW
ncbi:MAG: phosphotransferase family protein [Chloroflexota bacterium]|nr:MAG: hypothetical protein DLM70_16665 [Chloroflexota bacterium]